MIDRSTLTEPFVCNEFAGGDLMIERLLGKGKSGYSYLVHNDRGQFVLKVIHDEPCAYYHFPDNKAQAEVDAYQRLRAAGVKVPELYYYDLEQQFLIKQYIANPTIPEMFIKEPVDDAIIQQVLAMADNLKVQGYNIDYFPTNFVIENEVLYYVDYEINTYDEQWGLKHWGLYYWANLKGVMDYLADDNILHINASLAESKPIEQGFVEQVQQWLQLN